MNVECARIAVSFLLIIETALAPCAIMRDLSLSLGFRDISDLLLPKIEHTSENYCGSEIIKIKFDDNNARFISAKMGFEYS